MKRRIENRQIKIIHTATNFLNIDDENYREILEYRYQKRSCKELTFIEAIDLINYFKDKGFKPVAKGKATPIKRNNKVVKLVSGPQKKLIEVLKSNIVWRVSYDAWLNNRMKIKKVVTTDEARKVIEGLKCMIGIDAKDIEFLRLPFPAHYDIESIVDKWFYSYSDGKLIHVKDGAVARLLGENIKNG